MVSYHDNEGEDFCASEAVIFFTKAGKNAAAMELESYVVLSRSRRNCVGTHSKQREVYIR